MKPEQLKWFEIELLKTKNQTNICFDCKKACGGCSWSEVDRKTNQIRFELPEGCVTEKSYRNDRYGGKTGSYIETLRIVSCPLFERG